MQKYLNRLTVKVVMVILVIEVKTFMGRYYAMHAFAMDSNMDGWR